MSRSPCCDSQTAYRNGTSAGPVRLTSAESRVLPFLPTQLTIEEIAERIGRRRSTVKTHVAHIYKKLGVAKRTEAVERARELGLLSEPVLAGVGGYPREETTFDTGTFTTSTTRLDAYLTRRAEAVADQRRQ